ncbi:hypothetical protein [Terriglobus sp. TAA 43]|uniref:hypothetical protein n=1 Tax=Terriglobus sp. TAA 43 TaxID=278961 RepID=UPI00064912B4|nr:hypothetical protein [Terriglobus sp. TAA 43]
MKLLAGTLLCVLMVAITGCKPDAAVKHGAVIDAAPSGHDTGKAGQAAPTPPQQNQPQAQTPPPVKVQ